MNFSNNPLDAQERHGDYQIVLNEKRKKLAESLLVMKKLEEKIHDLSVEGKVASESLTAEVMNVSNRVERDQNAVEEAELIAERYYYEWVLAIWRNRKINSKRLNEICQEIQNEMIQHDKSANSAKNLQSKDRYHKRIENLKHFFIQINSLLNS